MIGVLVIAAVVPNVYGVAGVLMAVLAVLAAFLIIGAAMTLANKRRGPCPRGRPGLP